MKNHFLFILSLILVFSSCRNANTADKGTVPSPITRVTEKIDTPDCQLLIVMNPLGSDSWEFTNKNPFRIKNVSQPDLNISLFKETPYTHNIEKMTLSFDIDSSICVDTQKRIMVAYSDSSTSTFYTGANNNCSGHFITALARFRIDPNLQKLREHKIRSIKFETHNGTMEYLLNDIQATELQYLINCIHRAK